jgi:hypothetical protein
MPWLLTLLKQIGSWLIPMLVKEIMDAWIERQKEKREQKEEKAKDEQATKELVKESQVKEGVTDEEISKAQESAWDRFVAKFKRM